MPEWVSNPTSLLNRQLLDPILPDLNVIPDSCAVAPVYDRGSSTVSTG